MTVFEVFIQSEGGQLPISRQNWESKMKYFAQLITRTQMRDVSGNLYPSNFPSFNVQFRVINRHFNFRVLSNNKK